MSNFTPEQIQEILDLYFENFAHRQYIGARYVPIFGRKDETSIEWDNSAPYEPLTVVLHEGNSYTSRQFVPVGVAITNELYWAETGNFNAQIEQYRQEVLEIVNVLPLEDFSLENTVKDSIDNLGSYVVNVLKYGLVGNGTTDNTANFNTIKDLPNNAIMYFPEGEYLFEESITFEDKHILGAGIGKTVFLSTINTTEPPNNIAFWVKGCTTIKGVEFRDIHTACLYLSQNEGSVIESCKIGTTSVSGENEYAITVSHSKDVIIRNCIIDNINSATFNNADGIHINGGCENILLENISGLSGDDFVAINAAEPGTNPASIKNIVCRNIITKVGEQVSTRGIRIYGKGASQSIENVLFENCKIFTKENNIRPVIITNASAQTGDVANDKLVLKNLRFVNCEFDNSSARNAVICSYVEANSIVFENCQSAAETMFYGYNSDITELVVNGCGAIGGLEHNANNTIGTFIYENNKPTHHPIEASAAAGSIKTMIMRGNHYATALTDSFIKLFGTIDNVVVTGNYFGDTTNVYFTFSPSSVIGIIHTFGNYMPIRSTKNNIALSRTDTRLQSDEIICATAPTAPQEGDYYIHNNSGTLSFVRYLNGAWS